MEIRALIMNLKRIEEDADGERSGLFTLPLEEDEIRERLNFDEAMTGIFICFPDNSILEEVEYNPSIEEVNHMYHMLESLEGKVHEDDILEVKKRWFSSVKEMCENVDFIAWISNESEKEETARKSLEHYASSVPVIILKCVNVMDYADELLKNEEIYLITSHGAYSFDEPVY